MRHHRPAVLLDVATVVAVTLPGPGERDLPLLAAVQQVIVDELASAVAVDSADRERLVFDDAGQRLERPSLRLAAPRVKQRTPPRFPSWPTTSTVVAWSLGRPGRSGLDRPRAQHCFSALSRVGPVESGHRARRVQDPLLAGTQADGYFNTCAFVTVAAARTPVDTPRDRTSLQGHRTRSRRFDLIQLDRLYSSRGYPNVTNTATTQFVTGKQYA